MSNLESYQKMLQSEKASVRYEACEELRIAMESSPEIILALEKAQDDADADVAERARAALDADVHRQMAIKMSGTEPSEKDQPSETPQLTNGKSSSSAFVGIYVLAAMIGCIGGYVLWNVLHYQFPKGVWQRVELDGVKAVRIVGVNDTGLVVIQTNQGTEYYCAETKCKRGQENLYGYFSPRSEPRYTAPKPPGAVSESLRGSNHNLCSSEAEYVILNDGSVWYWYFIDCCEIGCIGNLIGQLSYAVVGLGAMLLVGAIAMKQLRLKQISTVIILGAVGWVLYSAIMFVGTAVTDIQTKLILHAVGAPVIFSLISALYFSKFNYTSPLQTALAFLAIVILLDFFILALLIERTIYIFRIPLITWIPFGLIFLSTYLTGLALERRERRPTPA